MSGASLAHTVRREGSNAGEGPPAVAVACLPFARGKAGFYACMALWDVGEAVMTAALTAYAADVTREEQRGAMNSLASQVQDAVFVVLPVLLGAIAVRTSNAVALALAAGLMLASTVAFTWLAAAAPSGS